MLRSIKIAKVLMKPNTSVRKRFQLVSVRSL